MSYLKSTTSASPSSHSYSHYSSAKLIADTGVFNNSEVDNESILPYDGELDINSNYTGFVQLTGTFSYII